MSECDAEYIGEAIIMISEKKCDISIWVNKDGNLELRGIGSVNYTMVNDELMLMGVDTE